jgi:hypothetical protein
MFSPAVAVAVAFFLQKERKNTINMGCMNELSMHVQGWFAGIIILQCGKLQQNYAPD